ncbi:MAG: HAD hydrolase-like protein [Pirellulales bacterium]|nr:HAD hydrolase-like protein [Pirellulales bacterium]
MHICLLDIDGTLIRTGGAGQTAFAQTFSTDFGVAEIKKDVVFAGRSDRAIVVELFQAHDIEPSEANWSKFYAGYLGRLESALASHRGCVLPGVVELLECLAARSDVALGLLTGNVREGARRKLSHYDLWHWFPFGGFGDNHVERNDIAAAALEDARRHLSQDSPANTDRTATRTSDQVIVIGDTPNDIRCGRSIGAHCVAVATGHTSLQELRNTKADLLLNTLEDLSGILTLFQ